MEYSGAGAFQAVLFSGKTLSGGTTGVNAGGVITIINNDIADYSITIGGVKFTEGTDFEKGATSAETAESLIDAINGNAGVAVSASISEYDILVNNLKTLVFESLQEIPFYEIPKLKIELRKTSDNQIVVANLPNPAHNGIRKIFAGKLESEVYVFI
jgi:hypothetical protein